MPSTLTVRPPGLIEVRRAVKCEIRAKAGSPNTLEGYAAPFNSASKDLGGFVEVIRPGAFSRAILDGQDVRMIWSHDRALVMARTKSGTLRMAEDATGLHFEAMLADSEQAKNWLASIERGDVDSMSFGFWPVEQKWDFNQAIAVRELIDVDLEHISPVMDPAYEDTAVAIRSYEEARAQNARGQVSSIQDMLRRRRLHEAETGV